MIDLLFLAHPRSLGEAYREHARIAIGFGGTDRPPLSGPG